MRKDFVRKLQWHNAYQKMFQSRILVEMLFFDGELQNDAGCLKPSQVASKMIKINRVKQNQMKCSAKEKENELFVRVQKKQRCVSVKG